MVASGKISCFWFHAQRKSTDECSLPRFNDALRQVIVCWRVDVVQPARQYCDGAASSIQRAGMCDGIDAERQSADDRNLSSGQFASEAFGDLPPIAAHFARADNGQCITPIVVSERTTHIENRGRVFDLSQQGWIRFIAPGNDTDAQAL